MAGNDEMIDLWNSEATESWVLQPDRYDRMLQPFSERVLEELALQRGERVLDIGCGSGSLSRAAAEAVGADGRVTGVDVSRPMLELARRKSTDAGLGNTEFVEADAQVHDLPAGAFDAVTSRFGVMFFADPVAAFANIRRAVAQGGRLAFAAWQALDANQWAMVPVMAIVPHAGIPNVPPPGSPGPFAFADADRVRQILTDAGWSDVEVEPFRTELLVAGGASMDEAVDYYADDVFGRMLLADADDDTRTAAKGALREALEEHVTDDGIRLEGAVWVVTAR